MFVQLVNNLQRKQQPIVIHGYQYSGYVKRIVEIGFYFVTQIDENIIQNNFKSLDGDSNFKWISIEKLEEYNILAKPIKDQIFNRKINNDTLEHIIYREY